MKIPLVCALGSLVLGCTASAQSSEAAPPLFRQSDLMQIGVYYYPEAWPESQWARDIANMKKMHLEFVHMGEFAWAFMEPEEGKFDFTWLDRAVQLCADQGLKVILCTPSPAPPIWLEQAHPEILMVDAQGRSMLHGTRQQATWSSDTYRHYVGLVVDALGKRYGNNPAVWGWQLDNELSHYGKGLDYSDSSQIKFRAWLKNKYGTVAELNSAWGNSFWSQMYQNFDQIRLPNQAELVAQINPEAVLDSQRWYAEEAADYLRFQTNILRKYCGHSQWVTTNYMHMNPEVDPALSVKDFEVMTWTHYPVHGELNADAGPLAYRLGNGASMSFFHDYMRNLTGFEGQMELQPGQVNWGEVNPQPYPGAVHLWIMRAFAEGSVLTCSYRFREVLSGAEMYHYGFVGTDGVTPTIGGIQYSQAAQEMELLRTHYRPDSKIPAAYAARRAAILYSVDSRRDIDNHKQNVRWDTMAHTLKYYRALKDLGCPVDVITEDKDFSAYPFLIVPADQLVDAGLVQRWTKYAQGGGHLIVTCRTGQKDRHGHLWEAPWAGPILDLIGAKIKFYDTLPAPVSGSVEAGGHSYDWFSWGEVLDPDEGTTALAHYADQFYAGGVAAVTRHLGSGTVTYVGVDSKDGGLEAQLVRGVYQEAGVPVENFDDGFLVDWRDGFWVATNFTAKVQAAPVPSSSSILVGSKDVPIAGVTVWQE